MRKVRATGALELAPTPALELWADPRRWPAFVEGFERIVELDPRWPQPACELIWESGPQGRGRVTERVVEHEAGRRLVTDVREEPLGGGEPRLRGRQALALARDSGPAAGSRIELGLDYELLRSGGAPGPLTDLLFVRRALRDALGRTLERFAAEAAREAAR